VAAALEEIVTEMQEADVEERKEILIDFARKLPPLPDRYVPLKDGDHRVHECQSPVFVFVELNDGRVTLHADAPIEAPTVRGFVSLLSEGLAGATVAEALAVRNDLLSRLGLAEVLGMLRMNGLNGVLNRVRAEVLREAARGVEPAG
jgi:cysteine desulfuration protein SufE